jgi:hypothetical protein
MAAHPDRLPAEFILSSDPAEQKAIVEDIAGSTYIETLVNHWTMLTSSQGSTREL